MPLALAIRNREAIVVATDTDTLNDEPSAFGQLIPLPAARTVVLLAGNLEAVRHAVMATALPKLDPAKGAAGVAQILQAALTLEVAPQLEHLAGRLEIIVAGIDRIRHTEAPSLYSLDSAQAFRLTIVPGDMVAIGATAAVTNLLAGHSLADSSADHLQVLAKECLSATKLRWPTALASHVKLGVITAQRQRFQIF